MIKLLQIAVQTFLGWTVITCGVPAAEIKALPPGGFREVSFVCLVEIEGRRFGASGVFADLDKIADQARFSMEDYQ